MKPAAFILLLFISSLTSKSFFLKAQKANYTDSWKTIQQTKKGNITILCFGVKPFVMYGGDEISGIEYDIMKAFIPFLKKKYDIDISVAWKRASSFESLYKEIKHEKKENGLFGISNVSITPLRKEEVSFSPAYMPDVSVLVSGDKVPVVSDISHFKQEFKELSAITIKNTTYEERLMLINEQNNLNFDFKYVSQFNEMFDLIISENKYFGYVDLPTYILAFEEGVKIKRHNIFKFQNEGYGVIIPINSDWKEPLTVFFESNEFKLLVNSTIKKYLGEEISELTWKVGDMTDSSTDNEVALLTKEKEIQSQEIVKKVLEVQRQKEILYSFIVGIIFLILVAVFIYGRYQLKKKANRLLSRKNIEIERQKVNIRNQNIRLEETNEELVSLNEEKNELIGVVAHDLRSPLNEIKGMLTIMKLISENLNEEQIGYLDKMMTSTNRLRDMISRILDVDAIESNKISVKLEVIDLNKIIEEVVNGFKITANKKNIGIVYTRNEIDCKVSLDCNYLIQVLENLLSNAIKFSPYDKNIYVKIYTVANKVRIEVKDEGPGFSEEDMKKLFGKFQKLSARPTGGEESSGLGLSIVKRYVEAMEGTIWVESEKGKGAAFTIEFAVC